MSHNLAILLVIFTAASSIQGYCVFKNRHLHARVTKTLLQASRWLIETQDKQGKWYDIYTTGHTLAVLRMLGHDLHEKNSCSKTFKKGAKLLNTHEYYVKRAYGGNLAYIIMGLNALCKDPGEHMKLNLTKRLLRDVINYPEGKLRHEFQYALAMVVIGINNVQVPWLAVHRIIQRANHIISRDIKHSKDTCALLVMALESVSGQFKDKPQRYKRIKMYINTLANILARKTSIDDDNLWTKALVMQAHSAIDRPLPWEKSKCERLYNSILDKKGQNGMFGGLSAVLHVLPSLAGVSLLDLRKDDQCAINKVAEEKKRLVTVCVRIEFEAINKTNPPYQYVRLAADSTAYDALSAAQELHPCYKNVVKTSSHGLFLTSLCNEGTSEAKGLYWMFYLDDKLSSLGLNEQRVKENQCIVLKYKELAVKK